MIVVKDDLKKTIQFSKSPNRIVSLTPSSTETICTLGGRNKLIGVTRYCVHPHDISVEKTIVGGTKSIDFGILQDLKPDLVVANAEENTTEIFRQIERLNIPLYVAFPKTIDDAICDLRRMGILLQSNQQAEQFITQIEQKRTRITSHFRYIYLIWQKPYMAVNSDTFIHHMISEIGGINLMSDHVDRYPTLDVADISRLDPDIIFLSSEPFPFQEKHLEKLTVETRLPHSRFHFIDGEMCSWHGVRMAQAMKYLQNWRIESTLKME